MHLISVYVMNYLNWRTSSYNLFQLTEKTVYFKGVVGQGLCLTNIHVSYGGYFTDNYLHNV